MTTRSRVTVKPTSGGAGWDVDGPEGGHRFDLKSQAVAYGRLAVRAIPGLSQLQIYRSDGTVETEHTYGSDLNAVED